MAIACFTALRESPQALARFARELCTLMVPAGSALLCLPVFICPRYR